MFDDGLRYPMYPRGDLVKMLVVLGWVSKQRGDMGVYAVWMVLETGYARLLVLFEDVRGV